MAIGLLSCKGESTEHSGHEHMDHSAPTTGSKSVPMGNYTAVFDLTTMEDHLEMMKMMNTPMEHDENSTHAITLTINDGENHPVGDAEVVFQIKTPAGEIEKAGMVMKGEGMAHYMVGFDGSQKGEYTFTASVTMPGEPVAMRSQAVFTLPL